MPHDSGPTTLYRLFSAEEDPRPVKLWPGTLAQFADCCEVCVARNGDYDVHIADATCAKGEGLTARYRCGTCGHVWTCWWAWRIAA